MTPKQYQAAIAAVGLSQRAAGPFLGVGERQSRKWVAGEARIPDSVAKLLRVMIARNISVETVERINSETR